MKFRPEWWRMVPQYFLKWFCLWNNSKRPRFGHQNWFSKFATPLFFLLLVPNSFSPSNFPSRPLKVVRMDRTDHFGFRPTMYFDRWKSSKNEFLGVPPFLRSLWKWINSLRVNSEKVTYGGSLPQGPFILREYGFLYFKDIPNFKK